MPCFSQSLTHGLVWYNGKPVPSQGHSWRLSTIFNAILNVPRPPRVSSWSQHRSPCQHNQQVNNLERFILLCSLHMFDSSAHAVMSRYCLGYHIGESDMTQDLWETHALLSSTKGQATCLKNLKCITHTWHRNLCYWGLAEILSELPRVYWPDLFWPLWYLRHQCMSKLLHRIKTCFMCVSVFQKSSC